MAETNIYVESAKLESVASEIAGIAGNYKTNYQELYQQIEDLSGHWQFEDNTAFVNQIKGFNDDFEAMFKLMNDYQSFLTKSATSYRSAQNELESQAKTLQN